jgi:hypothetical protein
MSGFFRSMTALARPASGLPGTPDSGPRRRQAWSVEDRPLAREIATPGDPIGEALGSLKPGPIRNAGSTDAMAHSDAPGDPIGEALKSLKPGPIPNDGSTDAMSRSRSEMRAMHSDPDRPEASSPPSQLGESRPAADRRAKQPSVGRMGEPLSDGIAPEPQPLSPPARQMRESPERHQRSLGQSGPEQISGGVSPGRAVPSKRTGGEPATDSVEDRTSSRGMNRAQRPRPEIGSITVELAAPATPPAPPQQAERRDVPRPAGPPTARRRYLRMS